MTPRSINLNIRLDNQLFGFQPVSLYTLYDLKLFHAEQIGALRSVIYQ